MEASEIIRRNEAVARFMGLEWDGEEGCWSDPRKGEYGLFTSRALRYDRDYSWLMPAVARLLSTNPQTKMTLWMVNGESEDMLIGAIWESVSEYCLSLEA